VIAYDVGTGDVLWRFKTHCPLTSDITVFETDDDAEQGTPSVDGYVDRAVFADGCGYVYKVDPGRDLAGGWNENTGLGAIATDVVDGFHFYALFSTATTTNALGQQAPIGGTLAARSDESSRVVLFFGTGGIESYDPTQPNEFYAVFADTGEIRSKKAGDCQGGYCEKFYGGVVVTSEQVIITRTFDPKVGTGTCDPGSSRLEAFDLDADASGDFVTDFVTAVASSVMGSLFGDRGAVYFATLGGDVVRVGSPEAANAGDDTAAGYQGGIPIGPGGAPGSLEGSNQPMTLLGWRQIY
jgi:hypothetical protein